MTPALTEQVLKKTAVVILNIDYRPCFLFKTTYLQLSSCGLSHATNCLIFQFAMSPQFASPRIFTPSFYLIYAFYKVIHHMLLSTSHAFHTGVLFGLTYYAQIRMHQIMYFRILFGIFYRIHYGNQFTEGWFKVT